MKNLQRWIGVATLASTAAINSHATNIESGTAVCRPTSGGDATCAIAWDLSADPRTYYRVERLDAKRQEWLATDAPVSTEPYGAGVVVAVEALYRVRGCDDPRFRHNCVSSTAVWAVAIRPIDEIPVEVAISNGDRSYSAATVSKSLDAYGQNSQYNVYKMTNLVNRAQRADLPPMHPPAEPAGHGDLEHQIQHNVQSAYEALRALRQHERRNQGE